MSKVINCPNCKGKGHVMDGSSAFVSILTIVLIPTLFTDANDPDGMTRKKCEICDGKGQLKVQ